MLIADRVCAAWPQIGISKDDKLTDGTASQIEKANVGREALGCAYDPVVKSATPAKPPAPKAAPVAGLKIESPAAVKSDPKAI